MQFFPGWPKSIYLRMFLVICVTVLPAFAGLGYYVHKQRNHLIEFSKTRAQQYIELAAHDESWLFHNTEHLLNLVQATPVVQNKNWTQCHQFISTLLRTETIYRDIGIFSTHGKVLCSGLKQGDTLAELDFSDRPYFSRTLGSPGAVLGEYYVGRISEAPIFLVTTAMRDPEGTPTGILYASINPQVLAATNHRHDLDPNMQVLLLDRDHAILKAIPNNSLLGSTLHDDIITSVISANATGTGIIRRPDGSEWLVSHARIGTTFDPDAVTIVHTVPTKDLLSGINDALWRGTLITLLLALLALSLGWWGLQAFVGRNIRLLTAATKQLGQRTYNQPITHSITGTEFQEIATTLDKVALDLDELEHHWETSLVQRQSEIHILRLIANDRPLDECLTALIELIQEQIPDSSALILLLDNTGTYLETCIGHKLPELCSRLHGASLADDLGWHIQAIRQKEATVCTSTQVDPLWQAMTATELVPACQAGWSYPIIATDSTRSVLGAINVYLQSSYQPAANDLNLGRMAAGLAIVAIAQQRQQDTLNYQSRHDPLTGLYNRHTLSAFISQALHSARATQHRFCILMIDLDGFKEVNNTLGHELGDSLLKKAGQRLVRVIGNRGQVGRSGNDEYLVLVEHLPDNEALEGLLQSILQSMRQPYLLQGIQVQISASIGVACYPDSGNSLHPLLRHAEAAMYLARNEGSGFSFYEPSGEEETTRHLMILSSLRGALQNNEFVLHFQPKINLKTGAAVGMEALIRWEHPEKGLISPQDFINVAELSDLIHPLTLWVIEESVRQCSIWRQLGYPVSVAANISARNLLRNTLPEQIRGILERHQFPVDGLRLEITESAIMDDLNRTLPVLQKLRNLGIMAAIDDFGTGYSSLAYLRRLPVDNLKIDRSFISKLDQKPEDREIVMTIINLAHSLKLSVTAEGVENLDIQKVLRRMGCDFAQGYGISKPMAAHLVPDWLQQYAKSGL